MAVSEKTAILPSQLGGGFVQSPYADRKTIASSEGQLWEVVAVGDLTAETENNFEKIRLADNRFLIERSSNLETIAWAQIEHSSNLDSLLNLTLSQSYLNFDSNDLPNISTIVWVVQPDSLDGCLEFWNTRALRPTDSIEMILLPQNYLDGKSYEHFRVSLINKLNLINRTLSKDLPLTADVVFYSNEISEEKLNEIAGKLRLEKYLGIDKKQLKEVSFQQHRIPTYIVEPTDKSPLDHFKFHRKYGYPIFLRANLYRDFALIEFSSPIQFFDGGKLLIKIKGEHLEHIPQRNCVAQLFDPKASWSKKNLQLQQDFQNNYEIRLSLPTKDEIVRTLLDEKTKQHEPSKPGRQASSLAEQITFEQILTPGLFGIIMKLTTPRSKTLMNEWREAQKQGEEQEAETIQKIIGNCGSSLKRQFYTAKDLDSQLEIKPATSTLSTLELLSALELAERGLKIECDRCRTPSFIELSDVRGKAICPACGGSHSYKANEKSLEIFYRLNGFIDLCSDQGVIPHLLVAATLNRTDPNSYLFMGQDVWFKDEQQEIDIFGIYKGKVIGGEIKTSSSEFTESRIKRDVELSKKLGVDIHLMACAKELTEESKGLAQEKVEGLQDYNMELLFLDSNDFWPPADPRGFL